jgi:redox-sensitive bicupin YhaK (pirin superfamily)
MMNEIELIIPPRAISLEGFPIVRLLPYSKRRTVGPFIFLDHMPETTVHPGSPLDVKPHPHIGLSTLSYLFKGQVLHRDSLGNELVLKPGDVNWMTAGNGIVHSERTPDELRENSFAFQMLQFWVALPKEKEDMGATFEHHEAESIPHFKEQEAHVKLIAGSAFGKTSPVSTYSKLFFMSLELKSGSTFTFDTEGQEAALYLLNGAIDLSGTPYGASSFLVFKTGSKIEVHAKEKSELVIFGGEALPEPRTIYWNFVSTSKDKIEAAKARWVERKFPSVVHDNEEFTPLPPQF